MHIGSFRGAKPLQNLYLPLMRGLYIMERGTEVEDPRFFELFGG